MTTGFVLRQGFQNVGIGQVEGSQVLQHPQAIEGGVCRGKVERGLLTVVVGVRDDIQLVRREHTAIVNVILILQVTYAKWYIPRHFTERVAETQVARCLGRASGSRPAIPGDH